MSVKRPHDDDVVIIEDHHKSNVERNIQEKRRRHKGPLSREQLKRKQDVIRRRDEVRRINRREMSCFGAYRTMFNIDRLQRMKSENDELDENVDDMIQEVIRLRDNFVEKLKKRDADIASGKVDANEPTGKEKARQIKQWLATVPTLLAQHELNKKADLSTEFELTQLTTVFNYVHQGNNGGHDEDEPSTSQEHQDDASDVDESDTEDIMSLHDEEEDDAQSDLDESDVEESESDDEQDEEMAKSDSEVDE